MDLHEFLVDAFYFLLATLTFVPLFRWLKLGSMLGYITAGVLIGPMCLGLIDDSKSIYQLAELGIILLLFMVGLELSPIRLKALRKDIIVEGGFQMLLTTLTFSTIGFFMGLNLIPSFLVGIALSLSSTAFALTYLTDNSQLTLSHGQSSLSILLFQDLLIVPILALIPLFSVDSAVYETLSYSTLLFKIIIFCSLLIACFFVLRPAISFIRKTQDQEIYLAAFLFLIIGMAIGMEKAGLSMGIGSFIAGVLLANSDIKKNIKYMTNPFKGVLMGLFFMTLGMEFEFIFLTEHLGKIAFIFTTILITKSMILLVIGRVRNGNFKSGFKVSVLLSQGGEFGIVVLGSALHFNILNQEINKLLVSSIIITMVFSPFLARIAELINRSNKAEEDDSSEIIDSSNVILIDRPLKSDKKSA